MWWYFNKKKCLKKVKWDLLRSPSKRLLKSTMVIGIIQHVIDTNREDILKSIPDVSFNPLNDSPLILHILDNYKLMKPYPEHRYYIKKIF